MKHLLIVMIVLSSFTYEAQSDTLYLKDRNKIPVKLYEVSDYDIKYRRTDLSDGPIYTTNIENVLKIKYSNGTEQVFLLMN